MAENKIIIFTDGASKGNPGPGGWGAIIVNNNDAPNNADQTQKDADKVRTNAEVTELGGFVADTTNNRMELTAVIEALRHLSFSGLLTIDYGLAVYSDSSYVINGATKWLYSWQKNNWQTKTKAPVLNRDLWEEFLKFNKVKIDWHYVGGHIGIAGNERADEIASGFAAGGKPYLFNGSLADYKIDLSNLKHNLGQKIDKAESRSRSRAKAYSYVSKVDGVVQVHATWAECEAWVKGQSGALYKKALSAEDERAIIENWR